MNIGALAPVRRAVPLRRGDSQNGQASLAALLGVQKIWLYASGTDALQAVLTHCARRCEGTARTQVILPAYGCPDLVTACIGAGLQPKLVDVDPQGWGYSSAGLIAALSHSTAAVVAVNLLGVGDDARRLRSIITDPAIALVQDSAQCLPRAAVDWPGDFQTFSFGRGKPLNLLGGGAATVAPTNGCIERRSLGDALWGSRVGALLFNLATAPLSYQITRKLPGLGIGLTRYRPPQQLHAAPPRLACQLDAALPDWIHHGSYNSTPWVERLPQWQVHGIAALTAADGSLPSHDTLRLPLLAASPQLRDRLVERLAAAGLGATALYGTALHHVAAIPDEVREQGPFPAAERLAQRLFTLPTHSGVTIATIRRTERVVREVALTLSVP